MYEQILVGVDLSEENQQVLEKAITLQKLSGAHLHIVHVVEPLTHAFKGDIPYDIDAMQADLKEKSQIHLQSIVENSSLENTTCAIAIGRPEVELHLYAEENAVDVIIVGSHGRHGLRLLLGSTANGVLHGASCDVLAVRMPDR